jgi:hypothetical protein
VKRWWRIFDYILPVLAALLLAATVALWVRSYWVSDFVAIGWRGAYLQYQFMAEDDSGRQDITLTIDWTSEIQFMHLKVKSREPLRWEPPTLLHRFGFYYVSDFAPKAYLASPTIGFPYWFAALTFASIPLDRLVLRRWRARCKEGFCNRCGYDLRASHGRCPECGQAFAPRPEISLP